MTRGSRALRGFVPVLLMFGGPSPALSQGLPATVGAPASQVAEKQDGQQDEEARLETLRLRAVEVFETSTPDAEGNRRIVAAWKDLQDAARAVDPAHRLIGYAQIKQASQIYRLGQNADAQAMVEAGLDALPGDDSFFLPVRGEGVALLGTILAQAGEAGEAIDALRAGYASFMRGYDAVPADQFERSYAMSKSNLEFSLSQVLLRLSEVDEALAFQKASLDTREGAFGANDPDTVASYYGYAGALRRAGRMDEAEANARIAVTRAVAHVDPSHPSYARALEMLAIVLSRSGRPIEATDYLTRALELKREHEGADSLFFGYGIHQLGTILHQRERYDDAVPLFEEAQPIFAEYQGEESPFGLGSLAYAGQGQFALGQTQAAVERLSALNTRLGEGSRDLEIVQRIGPDLARGLVRMGRIDDAEKVATGLYERLLEAEGSDPFAFEHAGLILAWTQHKGAKDTAPLLQAAFAMLEFIKAQSVTNLSGFLQTEQRTALDLVMEIAVDTGDLDLLASAMALASATDIARATELKRNRALAQDEGLQSAIRTLQNAEDAYFTADRNYIRALSRSAAAQTDLSALQMQAAEARDAREAARAALAQDYPEWQEDSPKVDASLAAIRAGLAPGEAFLALIPAYDGAYSLLVTQAGASGQRLALPRAQVIALARAVRESAAAARFDDASAMALGSVLLPPETLAALGDVTVLKVLAGGPLASLPLGLLKVKFDAGASDNDNAAGAEWLLDRIALANVAGMDAGGKGQTSEQNPSTASFVAFAAPTPFGAGSSGQSAQTTGATRSLAAYFQREGIDADALSQLPPLPEAAREARAIAAFFSSSESAVFTGQMANEQSLSDQRVANADVLLFATHGLVAGEVEGIAEPALVLARSDASGSVSDGVLTTSEIALLDLSASWVILTACDSAAGFAGGLPAFSGLARAFRFAGGGSLLATHWKVRDDAAAFVAINAVRHYRENGNKALALRHAIRLLRDESGLPGANRPDIWAPFVLIE